MEEIERLPLDVLRTILFFTDNESKRYFRSTNTFFFNLVKYNEFCVYFTKPSQVPAIIERLSQYSWPISLTFKKPFAKALRADNTLVLTLSRLTNLTSLDVDELWRSGEDFDWSPLTALTNLLRIGELQGADFVGRMPQLAEVSYDSTFTNEFLAHLKTQTNLDALTVDIDSDNINDVFNAISNPSKLTNLHINSTADETSGSFILSGFDRLKEFKYVCPAKITIQLSSLESLRITKSDCLMDVPHCTNLTKLFCQEISPAFQNSLSKLTSLNSIDLFVLSPIDIDESTEFLTALTNLSNFRLIDYFRQRTFPKIISRLSPIMLKYLQYSINRSEESAFVVQQIGSLTNLVSLDFDIADQNPVDLSPLGALANLTELSIESEAKINSKFLAQLTNLKYLGFWTEDCELPVLPNLEFLSVMTLSPYGLQNLVHSTNLTDLRLMTGSVDFGSLACLPLVYLHSKMRVTSDWTGIAKLTTLSTLNLDVADLGGTVPDEFIYGLTSLINLTDLTINGTSELNPAILTCLSSLQSLIIPSLQDEEDKWPNYLQANMPYLYNVQLG